MRPAKYFIGKPIISISNGRHLGTVKDVYVDTNIELITGIYLGQEDIFSRKALLITRADVAVFGIDAILVKDSNVVVNSSQFSEVTSWLRRDRLQGRQIATTDQTLVGLVGDAVINDEAQIIGFILSRIFVEGAIAQDGAVYRRVITDVGDDDVAMAIDLAKAQRQRFRIRHVLKE